MLELQVGKLAGKSDVMPHAGLFCKDRKILTLPVVGRFSKLTIGHSPAKFPAV
jgi:hypothetical protein